jgi:hypothetical protein
MVGFLCPLSILPNVDSLIPVKIDNFHRAMPFGFRILNVSILILYFIVPPVLIVTNIGIILTWLVIKKIAEVFGIYL